MSKAAIVEQPRAYSYVRFSTPQQAHGDSLERQTEKAARYAAEHGLTLDTELSLADLGVSAYRGRNATTGALAGFIAAVERRHVPEGSYLLVENIDRLTRDDMPEAMTLFMRIINAGITVVTLTNGQACSNESLRRDPTAMVFIVVELMRANQESARKSQMVGAAKARKKAKLAAGELNGRPYTRQTPAWITWNNETKTYQLIEERAAIVREIFERAAQGAGIDGIAKDFNRRAEPTWGTGRRKANHWRGSYIRKILASSAPVGTFTPHTSTRDDKTRARRDIPMQGIEGLFPAVIDNETYGRATRRMRTTGARGRHAGAELKSLLAGVLKCKACGSSVVRVSKGGYTYLVCSRANARAHGCPYQAIRQDAFEGWMAEQMPDIIHDAPRGKSTAALDRQIAKLQAAADQMENETVELARLAAEERSVAARKALRSREEQLREAQTDLRALRAQRDNLTTASVADRLRTPQKAMANKQRKVREINDALKQAVQRIDLDLAGATVEIYWHHGDEPQELP
jgi:Resolvase, N terminal domain/Recombinase/Recombinase zinc beta ribbon domain